MSNTSLSRNAVILRYLAGVGALLLMGGCGLTAKKQQITFDKYTNLKLGFTTQSFIECVSVTKENAKKFIDYAVAQDFAWVELRDPNAILKLSECKEISDYARSKKIEVGYAVQKGLLDRDFWQIFNRGVENAAVFEGPGTFRALACGNEFIINENKKGWTVDEFIRLVTYANKAAQITEDKGLHFVVENGTEALKGDGATYFGLTEFFEKTNPNVGWQFDTANFFSGSRGRPRVQDAKAFLEKNINNLYYIHLKTSKNNQAQPVLGDNELDFDIIFSLMSKYDVPYIAIELAAGKDTDAVYKNYEKSLKYLQDRRFISVR